MNQIIFTSDIDWAPEEVILDMIELFKNYNAKCTLFATHYSDVLLSLDSSQFEIGIHPNFNELLNGNNKNGNCKDIIEQLLKYYPEAKGVRSHSLTQSSQLLNLFQTSNLVYESNQFLPYQEVNPFRLWNGLIRVPFNWEDDIHYSYNKEFTLSSVNKNESLIIANFHPIHVFLNTDSQERYNAAKNHYHDAAKLAEYRNQTKAGARSLLIQLLQLVADSNNPKWTIKDYLENVQLMEI